MKSFERRLITEWRRLGLPTGEQTIVAAVSGGADSVSLLLALDELKKRGKLEAGLVVAHFDHRLRGSESRQDARSVNELARALGHTFELGKGKIAGAGNLEQNARIARYAFLTGVAKKHCANIVVTGHTVNDQAETFLMNLLRGSGPEGLRAMPPVRDLDDDPAGSKGSRGKRSYPVLLARPLLRWALRRDTEDYCGERGIEYRKDAMNEDMAFTRVRIRRELVPLLETFNPKVIEALARTSGLLAGIPDLPGAHPASGGLVIADLRPLSQAQRFATLRKWLKAERGNLRGLQLKHLEAIERLIQSRKSGRFVELPGKSVVRKQKGRLTIDQIKVEN